MQKTLTGYKSIAYGMAIVDMMKKQFIGDFPMMEGENMAIALHPKFEKMAGIPVGLLFNMVNQGNSSEVDDDINNG